MTTKDPAQPKGLQGGQHHHHLSSHKLSTLLNNSIFQNESSRMRFESYFFASYGAKSGGQVTAEVHFSGGENATLVYKHVLFFFARNMAGVEV